MFAPAYRGSRDRAKPFERSYLRQPPLSVMKLISNTQGRLASLVLAKHCTQCIGDLPDCGAALDRVKDRGHQVAV